MTKNFEKAKEIIQEHFSDGDCGIFNSRNIMGDRMTTLYCEDGLQVDICYYWAYFEVFGLEQDEWLALKRFYKELEKNN